MTLWTNGNAQGRLVGGQNRIKVSDASEIAAAINRRRLLAFMPRQDFSSQIAGGAYVRKATLADYSTPEVTTPFQRMRNALGGTLLSPPPGALGGTPRSPISMEWLWPLADADENKTIVAGVPQAAQVNFFQKINGTWSWTDSTLVDCVSSIRAADFNDLRQTVEWLTRGRWRLALWLGAGMFSAMPDTSWLGGYVANDSDYEVRTLGDVILNQTDANGDLAGFTGLTVRDSSAIEVIADANCTVQVYQCLRTIDYDNDRPTWNQYRPGQNANWAAPGGAGAADATLIGSVMLAAGVPGALGGPAVAAAVTSMLAGQPADFLFRRSDIDWNTISLNTTLRVEFDLTVPPG